MINREKIQAYILDFAVNDIEPFHIIISALIDRGLSKNPNEVAEIIVDLVKKEYLQAFWHSGTSGEPYVKIDELDEKEFLSDFKKRDQFTEYPEGKEYFFQTTEKGMALIEEK